MSGKLLFTANREAVIARVCSPPLRLANLRCHREEGNPTRVQLARDESQQGRFASSNTPYQSSAPMSVQHQIKVCEKVHAGITKIPLTKYDCKHAKS